MPVWKVTPISKRPSVTLRHWQVFVVTGCAKSAKQTMHWVGYNADEGEGRVSSNMVEFDITTMRGKTKQGRVYTLEGPPGLEGDGTHVWTTWQGLNEITGVLDVTAAFIGGAPVGSIGVVDSKPIAAAASPTTPGRACKESA
jgi:hypothetical protein